MANDVRQILTEMRDEHQSMADCDDFTGLFRIHRQRDADALTAALAALDKVSEYERELAKFATMLEPHSDPYVKRTAELIREAVKEQK